MNRKDKEKMMKSLSFEVSILSYYISAALLIWLFGVLVFIPIAQTLDPNTKTMCSLIFFIAFTVFVYRSIPSLRKMVAVFSSILVERYGSKISLDSRESLIVFRHILYICVVLIIYLLYSPFLVNIHPAINGMVLITALIWSFFLLIRVIDIFVRFYCLKLKV